MNPTRAWSAIGERQLVALAASLAADAREGGVIFLEGDLGAGKTTFARALLAAAGVGESIKSPTYSLVESYALDGWSAHHLDLYRIADAAELEWLGLADLLDSSTLLLVEWPERGVGALPAPDLRLRLQHAGDARDLEVTALSARGRLWLDRVAGGVMVQSDS